MKKDPNYIAAVEKAITEKYGKNTVQDFRNEQKDDLYMNRFECCYKCYVDFVEERTDRWNEGWRPTGEHLQTYLRRRK
jgi:hypothetical protein